MNTNLQRAPVFFISHGAPTLALEPGQLGVKLSVLGQQLSGIQAVLVALGGALRYRSCAGH